MSNKSTERKWDREEVVILVVEYFRTKNLSSDEINQTHQEISDFLRQREEILTGVPVSDIFRNYAGIHLQSGRIPAFRNMRFRIYAVRKNPLHRSGNALFRNAGNKASKRNSARVSEGSGSTYY